MEQVQQHTSGDMAIVSGDIFITNAPDSFPTPSVLTVKLSDVSLMDASSVTLAAVKIDVDKIYEKGKPLHYSISFQMPSDIGPDHEVEAVLNVGWTSSGDEWIRRGDYLTDTMHQVELRSNQKNYNRDIKLVLYQ